jgi:redox-sensing transcriptional repressor
LYCTFESEKDENGNMSLPFRTLFSQEMIKNGIIAIWNFTPVKLNVANDIIVENVDMSASLAVLSRRLAEKLYYSK